MHKMDKQSEFDVCFIIAEFKKTLQDSSVLFLIVRS